MEEKKSRIFRVAFVGPESTGKSTLSLQLAKYYNTKCIEESAVNYLKKIKKKYTKHDILKIAKIHFEEENKQIKYANNFLFVDTEFIISKVWCEDVFDSCPSWISKNILKHKYDIYFLTYPDLKWESGNFRENGNRRKYLFNIYESELKKINANYFLIRGKGEKRLNCCIEVLNGIKK